MKKCAKCGTDCHDKDAMYVHTNHEGKQEMWCTKCEKKHENICLLIGIGGLLVVASLLVLILVNLF